MTLTKLAPADFVANSAISKTPSGMALFRGTKYTHILSQQHKQAAVLLVFALS